MEGPDFERARLSKQFLLPLRPKWIQQTVGVTRQTYNRWIKAGIPADKFDDVLGQILEAMTGETKEAPPPDWAKGLIGDVTAIRGMVESEAIGLAALRVILAAIQSQLPRPGDDPADDPPTAPQAAKRNQ